MKFKVEDKIMISDPGHRRGDNNIEIGNIKKGKWLSDVNIDDVVEYITAYHDKHDVDTEDWYELGEVKITSGQLVIINDDKFYPEDSVWYGELSDSDEYDKEIPGGVYCVTGYGDGEYKVYAQEKNGEVVALELVFV